MNVVKFDRRRMEEEVWRELETFIAVDDWWLDE